MSSIAGAFETESAAITSYFVHAGDKEIGGAKRGRLLQQKILYGRIY